MSRAQLHKVTAFRISRCDFASPDALATALADRVAGELQVAIASRGQGDARRIRRLDAGALLRGAVGKSLDWEKVTVTLVDERFVPPDHERSNEALVRRHLIRGKAAKAACFGSVARGERAWKRPPACALLDIARLPTPLDVVVLGMGTDGHTASFFRRCREFSTF
jgi:6-phosphogluconolactonase